MPQIDAVVTATLTLSPRSIRTNSPAPKPALFTVTRLPTMPFAGEISTFATSDNLTANNTRNANAVS